MCRGIYKFLFLLRCSIVGRAHRASERERLGCASVHFAWQARRKRASVKELSRCYNLISRLMARSAPRKLAKVSAGVYCVSLCVVLVASDNILLCGYVTQRSTKFSP